MSQPTQSLKERNAFSQWNSSGFVWASVGLAITTLTLVGVAWIQLVDPIPPEGVFVLLALGGVPAASTWELITRSRNSGLATAGRFDELADPFVTWLLEEVHPSSIFHADFAVVVCKHSFHMIGQHFRQRRIVG